MKPTSSASENADMESAVQSNSEDDHEQKRVRFSKDTDKTSEEAQAREDASPADDVLDTDDSEEEARAQDDAYAADDASDTEGTDDETARAQEDAPAAKQASEASGAKRITMNESPFPFPGPKNPKLSYMEHCLNKFYFAKLKRQINLGEQLSYEKYASGEFGEEFLKEEKLCFTKLKDLRTKRITFTFAEAVQTGCWLILLHVHAKVPQLTSCIRLERHDEDLPNHIFNLMGDELAAFFIPENDRVLPKPVADYIDENESKIKMTPFMFLMYFSCAHWAMHNKLATKKSRCQTKNYCEQVERFFKQPKNVKLLKTLFTDF